MELLSENCFGFHTDERKSPKFLETLDAADPQGSRNFVFPAASPRAPGVARRVDGAVVEAEPEEDEAADVFFKLGV